MRLLVLTVLAVLVLIPLADAVPSTGRYVGGAYVPGMNRGACLGGSNDEARPGVGAVCHLVVDPGARVLTVTDDLLGPRAFYWALQPPGVATVCLDGEARGSVSFVVPAGCTRVSAYVEAAATTGVVRAE